MTAEPRTGRPEVIDGRYELGERLGRGASADVFTAVHCVTRRSHALKRWRLALEHPANAARWKREILATQVRHPAIVPITDAGVDERRRPYVVMDRIEGEDLYARLERGALSVDEALEVFDQLIDGLAAAHAAGIVHRDLKPANVFLERADGGQPRVRVLDFGYALDIAITRITAEGVTLGSFYYMAPEQALASESLNYAADVWAVGVILYECLAGRRPFEADDIEPLVRAIHRGDITPVTTIAPHVPQIIGAVIAKCLCVDPAKRYPDAGVLRQAWSAVRATRPSWSEKASLDPDTRALWSGTSMPLPAYARVARAPATPRPPPAARAPAMIPITRPSHSGEPRPGVWPAPERFPVTSASWPEPSDFTTTIPSSSPPAPFAPRVRGRVGIPLVAVALMVSVGAIALLAARDTLLVPLLSGSPEDVGTLILDRFWTPAVNLASAACFLVAVLAAIGALVSIARRRERPDDDEAR